MSITDESTAQNAATCTAQSTVYNMVEGAKIIETKEYSDGTTVTGVAPLPDLSPAQQDAQKAPHIPIATLQECVNDEECVNDGYVIESAHERIDRLTDHVNREVGVAQEVPLCMRLADLEKLCKENFAKIKALTKLLD